MSPAQVLIYFKLHFNSAQGQPLSGLQLEPGDKETTYTEHGVIKTRKTTNSEEVQFLRKEISGVIKGVRAFESVFGTSLAIKLPETFEEIQEVLGDVKVAPVPKDEKDVKVAEVPDPKAPHVEEWTKANQEELVELSTQYKKTDEQKARLKELTEAKAKAPNLKRA